MMGLMHPTGPAWNHPAAPLLLEFGTTGCPVNCGLHWTVAQMQAAVDYTAHPSAQQPEAAQQLQAKTLEKVDQGYAKLVEWDAIRADPHQH